MRTTRARGSELAVPLIGGVVVFVVGAAGVLKLLDLGEFADAVRSWSLVPPWLVYPLAIGVPVLELGVLAAWLAGVSRRLVYVGAGTLLVAFTVAYVIQSLAGGPPRCGCLGAVSEASFLGSVGGVLARNVLLIGGLLLATRRTVNPDEGDEH